jgi:vacuolar-type H+-ATPase subunit I/STV1
MTTKSAALASLPNGDAKYLAGMDQCVAELATIRREMKKTDAEIRRLETATRRKLDLIRANLHVEKAA